VAEEGTSGDHSHASGSISKQYARQLHKELHDGATTKGRPLTDEQAELHIAKLRRRMLILPARYRQAELARIQQLEYCRRSPKPAAQWPWVPCLPRRTQGRGR
jgi:hypothetical protein